MNPIEQWRNDGAQHLLYQYPLNSRSVVFDVGGYKGQWSYDLLKLNKGVCGECGAKADPYVYIFEPIKAHYNECMERFQDYEKVRIFNIGLSNRDYEADITVDEAASCIHGPCPWRSPGPRPTEHVKIVDIDRFMLIHAIDQIDLISINIEGEEYDLVKRMIETGLIKRVDNLQVQFHDFMPNAAQKRADLQCLLADTHTLVFEYPFVWESWKRK